MDNLSLFPFEAMVVAIPVYKLALFYGQFVLVFFKAMNNVVILIRVTGESRNPPQSLFLFFCKEITRHGTYIRW